MQPQAPQGMPQQPMQAPQQPAAQARPSIEIDEFRHILKMLDENALKATANNPKYMQDSLYGPLVHAEVTNRVSIRQQEQMRQQQQAQQAQQQQQAQMQGQQGQMPPQQGQMQGQQGQMQGQQGQMPPQQGQQGPAPTEVDKVAQAANTYLAGGGYINTTLPEHSGIAPLARNMDYADGGIVALANGGFADDDLVEYDYQPESEEDVIALGGTSRDPNRKMTREELEPLINEASKKYGVPADALWRITGAESGYKPAVVNKLSGQIGGLGGVIPSTWESYGKGRDVTDPAANIDVTAQIIRDNQARLRKELKRDPTLSETYAAHWLGPGVSTALAGGRMDEPMDKALQRMSSKYDEALRKKVYAQNPDLKPDMTLGDFMALTEKKMGRPATASATETSAAAAAPSGKAAGLLAIMDRIDKGDRVPADLDPMGYGEMNPEQRRQAREQVLSVPAAPSGGRSTWLGIPTLWGEPEQKRFEDAERKLEENRRAQAGLSAPSTQPAPPRFTNTPIPMEPPVPDKPTGLGELGINTDQLRGAGATGMSFGAEFDTIAEAAKKIDPTLPSDPAKLLETAKATIPASKRKGMSDEALMMFFLNLMGGRSRSFLRNVGDAGIAALGAEQSIRKQEALDRKEQALAKYYEQMGASMSKDPEAVRTWKALGDGDIKKGAKIWSQIMAGKSPAGSESALRDKAVDNLNARLKANMVEQMRAAKDPAYYNQLFQEELKRLIPTGASGSGKASFLGFE